jgi:general secretion pathway protein B
MSYILEALKKAEQSRLAASPPDFTRVALSAEEPVREPRTRFSGLLLAAAVTGATAFGWWLSVQSAAKPGIEKLAAFVLPSRQAAAPSVAVPFRQAAQVAQASAQSPQDTHGTVQAKRLPAPTSRASAITDERELDIPPKALWVKPAALTINPAALTINPEKTANKAGSLKQKDPADPSGSSGLVAPEALSSDATKKQITALAVDVPVLKPDRGLRVFRLEELPPELRRELPKLSATGYVDSAEAGGRVVSINERSLREGDELIAGMKLELITPDYVLFRFRGYRFRIEMF